MNTDLTIRKLVQAAHLTAKEKGWWEHLRSDGEVIALIHAELSEALEALRNGNPPSDKISQYSGAEEELADCIIRIADFCGYKGWDLEGALLAKLEYNRQRPYRHGNKVF